MAMTKRKEIPVEALDLDPTWDLSERTVLVAGEECKIDGERGRFTFLGIAISNERPVAFLIGGKGGIKNQRTVLAERLRRK